MALRPGRLAWAWIAACGLALALGAAGFWVNGALGAGIGVAAGVAAPLLVEFARHRVAVREAARWSEPAQRRLGPASLLDPALGVVPFTGRSAELSTLRRWSEDDAAGPIRLITGGGGAGKTRLALELRRQLEAEDWRCAEIDSGNEASALLAEREAAGRRRLLLVVDYADARAGVAELLNSIARDPRRVRVLLLARQAGEWWQRLEGGGQAIRDMVADASRTVMELADAVAPGIAPVDVVRGALPYFAAELKVPSHDPDLVSVAGAEGARVLDLHAAALVVVLAEQKVRKDATMSVDVGMVLDVLLGHEKHYWLAGASSLGLLDVAGGFSAGQLSQVVAAACLLGAASRDEAAALAGRVPGAAASGAVALWLRGLYPPDGDGRWIGSLRPDRLAELHAIRELAASEDLARACLSGLDDEQARQALILLARASADHEAARPLLESALFRFPEVLAGIEAPRETMIAVANSIRFPSVTLAKADASITGRIVATYPPGTAERASWQGTYSTLLAALGKREEALAAIDEAVSIRRDLAVAQPDTFRPDLASSLSNQSTRLAELGSREEALAAIEEAVSIRRNLAATQPDGFGPDLAASLNNLSSCLAELGRHEEALAAIEEAAAIYRTARREAFDSELAASLNNQSVFLAELGRYEEALAAIEEAAATYRNLAAAHPDAFRPDLAMSLHNVSGRLAQLGRRKEALAAIEEAVSIRRDLAAAHPDAFGPDLAASLNNQSGRLAELGRHEEALAAIEEAAATYRNLAAAHPDAFRPDLAASLNNQSVFLAELGRHHEALAAIEEAVSIRRDLAAAHPDAFGPDLAASLNNQSGRLAELGRHEEALAAIEEAAATYRNLAAAHPDAFRPDLAASLNNQSVFLAELGRHHEALAAIEEAVSIRRDLAAAHPDAFGPDLAASLNNQSGRLAELGRHEEALAAIEEAAATYRNLAAAHPDAFRPDLAMSLSNQSVFLAELGRHHEALAAIEEAVSIRRDLVAAYPTVFSQRLGISLNILAAHLAALGYDAEANVASAEAESIRSQLP